MVGIIKNKEHEYYSISNLKHGSNKIACCVVVVLGLSGGFKQPSKPSRKPPELPRVPECHLEAQCGSMTCSILQIDLAVTWYSSTMARPYQGGRPKMPHRRS